MPEEEIVKTFIDSLKSPYIERMIGTPARYFVDLIPIVERIEDGIKNKRLVDINAFMAILEQSKKIAPKKKEGEIQMISQAS